MNSINDANKQNIGDIPKESFNWRLCMAAMAISGKLGGTYHIQGLRKGYVREMSPQNMAL